MRFTEILRLVFINLIQNKFKVILTSIGIVVGAATIVMVIAIGRGGEMDVADQFKNINAGAIDISYTMASNASRNQQQGGATTGSVVPGGSTTSTTQRATTSTTSSSVTKTATSSNTASVQQLSAGAAAGAQQDNFAQMQGGLPAGFNPGQIPADFNPGQIPGGFVFPNQNQRRFAGKPRTHHAIGQGSRRHRNLRSKCCRGDDLLHDTVFRGRRQPRRGYDLHHRWRQERIQPDEQPDSDRRYIHHRQQ